eukprot:289937-Prorocentrum_minimum.AAC.1
MQLLHGVHEAVRAELRLVQHPMHELVAVDAELGLAAVVAPVVRGGLRARPQKERRPGETLDGWGRR